MKLDREPCRRRGDSASPKPLGLSLDGGASGHRQDRRVQDGRHHPQDDGRKGLRPARLRAVRVRRRGPGARGRVRARARRAEGDRAAEEIASTWCAFGAASADILHVYEQVDIQATPVRRGARQRRARCAGAQARRAQMDEDGIASRAGGSHSRSTCATVDRSTRSRCCSPGTRLPANVRGCAAAALLRSATSSSTDAVRPIAEARLEIVTLRLRATAATPRPKLSAAATQSTTRSAPMRRAAHGTSTGPS